MTKFLYKIFLISILLISSAGLNPISREGGLRDLHFGKISQAINNTNNSFIIGGFNFARGGDGGSIQYGAFLSDARNSIAANLLNPTYISFPTLTSDSLQGVSVLILTSTYKNDTAISPLTTDEQNILLDYIKLGGCAILMADNYTFGGSPASSVANQSIIGPFDVTIDGFFPNKVVATVINPANSLITSGPFGRISVFSQNYGGFFTSDGIYANRIANNNLGGALDVINADAIQPGSGPVIIFSDTNTFFNEDADGFYYENENLFMNSIQFCYIRNSTNLFTISGRVTDSGGNGIPDVVVSALKSGWATTDAQGSYTISALPAGSYTLVPNNSHYFFNPSQYIVDLPPNSIEQNFIGKLLNFSFLPIIK